MIKTQAARTLLNQQRLPTHLLQRDQQPEPVDPQNGPPNDKIAELEELLAVMKRRNGPGGIEEVHEVVENVPIAAKSTRISSVRTLRLQSPTENAGPVARRATAMQIVRSVRRSSSRAKAQARSATAGKASSPSRKRSVKCSNVLPRYERHRMGSRSPPRRPRQSRLLKAP